MLKKWITIIVFALFAQSASAGLFGKSGSGKSIDEQYEDCVRHTERGYYTKALEVCNRVRNVYRDSPLSILAELSLANIYYKRGDYEQARIAYEDFARLHPRHEKLDFVQYRIGLTIYKRSPSAAGRDQTGTRQAVNAWTGFSNRFPDSEHLEEVTRLLSKSRNRLARKELNIARFYAKRNAWKATQARLEGLLKRYSDTETAQLALAELAIAYHRWGMTPQANEMRMQLNEQFPKSPLIAKIDNVLQQPAGQPPKEDTFVRPYRMSGGMAPPGGR